MSDDSPTPFQGRCHCGAVTLSVPRGQAFGVVACHCDDCQRLHGNFFAMLAAQRDAVTVDGAEAIERYASSATVQRWFCRRCGSRLAKDTAGSAQLLLSLGLFGRDTGLAIRHQVFTDSRPDWYTLPPTAGGP